MGVREIVDPGLPSPAYATSLSLTTTEYVGGIYALPARKCDAVIMAEPISSNVRVAHNHRFVYSSFSLKVLQVYKARKNGEVRDDEQIIAVQFGGTVRFRSGHEATFVLDREGFMEPRKHYVLFIWKPIRSDDAYVVAEAYLVENDSVFPIKTLADIRSYDGMPFKNFEVKVKAAIAKNIDTD